MSKYTRYSIILLLCIVGYLIGSGLPRWIINEMIGSVGFALGCIALLVLGWRKA